MLERIQKLMSLHKNKQILSFLIVLVILAALPITVIVSQQQQEIRQRAAEPTNNIGGSAKAEFAPGEVLVKFKTEVPPIKVKEEAFLKGIDLEQKAVSVPDIQENTLPSALDTLNQKYQIKTIEKVFKKIETGQVSRPETPKVGQINLSRIYKLKLDSAAPVLEIIEGLKKDPQVEYAEPNFIMTTLQDTSPTATESSRVFVTSTSYNGNLGGLIGADSKCQERADAANLGGTWKAWLSDSTTSVINRLNHSDGPYQRLDGVVVANNWEDLVDGMLQNAIYVTELKTNFSTDVWTNTKIDGTAKYTSDDATCVDWTSDSKLSDSTRGLSYRTNASWTDANKRISCNTKTHLYCFELTGAPPATPTPTPTPTPAPIPTLTPAPTPTITPTPVPGEPPNDPYYPQMWGLQKIQIENAWDITKGSNDVTVAVIDTGIDYKHEDLGGCLGSACRVIGGYDYVNKDDDPIDDHNHGTHVAGTIGALVNNTIGISGINWDVKLMAVKVLNAFGSGTTDNIVNGITYAADNGAKVINMSLGGRFRCTSSQTLQDAISYANAKGVTVVVAAGNSNADAANYSPASCQGVITVAATGPTDERSYYSNYGPVVDLAAPGGDKYKCNDKISCLIHSTISNNQYDFYQGTSMASPHVAGAAGLLLAKFSAYSPDRIQSILTYSSDYIADKNLKIPSRGRLNINNALSSGDILYSPKQIQEILKINSSSKRSITIFNNTDSQSISWDIKSNASWVTITNQSGSIAPQSTNILEILIDSTSLTYGTYNALLVLNTNNTQNQKITIPVSLTVPPSYNFSMGRTIGGKGSNKAVGSVRDNSGNIYMLGNFDNDIDFGVANLQTDNPEAFLAKYDSYGDIQWVKQIGNNKNMQSAEDIYIDEKNNIYILGNFSLGIEIDGVSLVESKTSDIFIAKINSNGNLLWLRGSPQDGKGYMSFSVTSDSEDNYYISAEVSSEESLIKFNDRGDELWRKKLSKIKDLKTKDNNLYATGDFALAKYDGNGNEIFKKENIGKFGEGNALTLDAFGNIYVVGYSNILVDPGFDPPDRDPLLLKYDSFGSLLWEKRFVGDSGSEYADSVTTDSDGNIYVAGRFNGSLKIDSQLIDTSPTDDSIFFVVFNPSGALLFLDMLNDVKSSSNLTTVQSVHVDSHKNIYLAGNYNFTLYYQKTTVLNSLTIENLYLVKLRSTKTLVDFHLPPNPGKAVYLNSKISYIEIYDAMNKLLMLPKFTFEAWIKPELNPYNLIEQTIFYRQPTSFADDSAFIIQSVPEEQPIPVFTNIQFMSMKSRKQLKQNIPLNKWSHIAFSRTRDKLRIFLNGEFVQEELLGSYDQIPANPGANLIIGASDILPGFTNLQARVSLDDVRFSDNSRDIESNWIKGLYQKPLENDSDTVALWRFEGNLNDDSKNHYIATSGGAITYIEGIVPKSTAHATSSLRASSPTQAVCNSCSADVNKDRKVNSSDLTFVRRCLNKSANYATGAYTCSNRDINKDGKIDIVDMNCVVRNFGKTCVR